jgi:hypothetical protein
MATKQWLRFNDDSRARTNREKHIAENGGEFVNNGRGWEWVATVSKPVVSKPAKKKVITKKKSSRKVISREQGEIL